MRFVFVYDGDCGFCIGAVRGLSNQIAAPIAYVPYQSLLLDQYGLDETACKRASQWVDLESGRVSAGYYAFVEALRNSTCAPWQVVAAIMALSPIAWFGTRFYNVVAKSRSLNLRSLFAARSELRSQAQQPHRELRVVTAEPGEPSLIAAVPDPSETCGCKAFNFAISHSLLAVMLLLWRWYTGELIGYGWGWQMYS